MKYTFYSFYGTERELKDIAAVLIEMGVDFEYYWMTKTIETLLPNESDYEAMKVLKDAIGRKHKTSRLNVKSEIQTDKCTLAAFRR